LPDTILLGNPVEDKGGNMEALKSKPGSPSQWSAFWFRTGGSIALVHFRPARPTHLVFWIRSALAPLGFPT